MKKVLIAVLCCVFVFTGGYVLATNINASEIEYNDTDVKSALDTLYNLSNAGSNLSNDVKQFLSTTLLSHFVPLPPTRVLQFKNILSELANAVLRLQSSLQ